ncbi:hypothetical protein CGCSCA4_v003829 [Colletotrichum siamense]|uniref:Uncharacterized protein n=1 Tax=Colletotrichum siamense TaxID=690259 RepID=A0A9P5K7S3_COLSI|nr:hypothetical protein CGCSCA4_v003829 [Colletotrichum siamense]KAF4862511.1 hypothetical protein CGCSCA2_v003575 [Colletotrichum siamense]
MHSATFGKGKRYGILGYIPEQGSKEAELYALNANTSPLLLPPPEIRNKIYALLLAHRRIHVLHAPRAHPPKFHCLTLRASANPWTHKRRHILSRGMTLLAGLELVDTTDVNSVVLLRVGFNMSCGFRKQGVSWFHNAQLNYEADLLTTQAHDDSAKQQIRRLP